MKKKKKYNQSTRMYHLIYFLTFIIILILIPILSFSFKQKTFSENENRYLAKMQNVSVENIKNRIVMNGLETYFSDHIIGRDLCIKTKTQIELLFGRYEQNGIYILKDRFVEKINDPDKKNIAKNLEAINKFSSENKIPLFFMLVPTSAEIYSENIPKNAPSLKQNEFINYVYDGLSDNVNTINVYNTLLSYKDEYIYYRTDHHWTSLGAYKAYSAAGKIMGYNPFGISNYDIEHASADFYGTFYSKTLYDKIKSDTVDIYHLNESKLSETLSVTTNIGSEPALYDSIYFREFLDLKDKYSVFLGTNQPVVTINTNSSGGKLLIFKDSYAHSYVPFLMPHYSEITLVDLRYIQTSLKDAVNINDYDQIMLLYNISSFSSDMNIRKLGAVE